MENDFFNQRNLLAEALQKVLVKAGVVRDDISLSGPELLLAAESYVQEVETCDVYTDGSCDTTSGIGGWAYVIPSKGIEEYGGGKETTNNRMEMQAIIEALRATQTETNVRILSDSQWCINVITGTWKATKNTDLVSQAQAAIRGRNVVFEWVRGHNGNLHNDRCDYLASIGRRT